MENPNDSISGKLGWPVPQVDDVTLLRAKNRTLAELIDSLQSDVARLDAEVKGAKGELAAERVKVAGAVQSMLSEQARADAAESRERRLRDAAEDALAHQGTQHFDAKLDALRDALAPAPDAKGGG